MHQIFELGDESLLAGHDINTRQQGLLIGIEHYPIPNTVARERRNRHDSPPKFRGFRSGFGYQELKRCGDLIGELPHHTGERTLTHVETPSTHTTGPLLSDANQAPAAITDLLPPTALAFAPGLDLRFLVD
jgi:hypothetical protein